jgi:DNA-binding NarL/FixJ family response regulator
MPEDELMQTRIVLADDHRLVREGLRRLLEENERYRVVGEASTGDEAVALATAEHPDVVVMDLTMPGISGIEATRRICGDRSGAKVLVLSMHGNRSYVEEVFKAGASGYVLKDAAASDLIEAIEAVCEGETFLSPSITQQVVDALSRPDELGERSLSTLTDREREVLTLIAEGLSSKEIGERLGVSLKTVESHRANLMDKLDIHKVSALVRFAIRAGLVAA